ncbi:MAG TPA: helix-turn-helix domain-containing protein [Chthonomonadaceae bacterium]|nr:helix-turn-helix domain-containing protein [Chthonomonadaceae bacterium]
MARRKNLNTPEKRARVGERIKLATTHAQLSLKEMAEQVGIPSSLIYQYVRGITSVPEEVLERIASVAHVHPDFFDPDKDARAALALPAAQEDERVGMGAIEPGTRARIQAELRHLYALAEAYNEPKRSRSSYISTLNQMLALARALEDPRQEAWVLWQLGRAKLEDNQLDEARQHLLAAVRMFADEGLEEYRFHTIQDLVMALSAQGEFAAAQSYLEEMLTHASRDVRWRTLITLGSLRYRQHDYQGALSYFRQAAEQLEQEEPERREREGMPYLMAGLADVVRATGHYGEAMMLWSRCLQQAIVDRRTDVFIESLMEVAQCCQLMGKISEAKQHLEVAVVLTSFLFEDQASLGVARALLANVLVAMGALDEAKENAKESLKIANRVRGARPTILSALAMTETRLAVGQWEDALDNAQDALDEAQRTGRTREVAQAHEMRARAYLGQCQEFHMAGDTARAQEALGRAFAEAQKALDVATRTESAREQIAAHLTLARCYYFQGQEAAAENAAREALRLTSEGAVGLPRLMGKEAENLPALLCSPELDLHRLFAGRKLDLPGLEWQAHYLEGTLLAKRLGPDAAFEAMRDAARAISRILNGLTGEEASAFQRRHPEVAAVFQDLTRFALTDAAQQEAKALLASTPWTFKEVALPAIGPSQTK